MIESKSISGSHWIVLRDGIVSSCYRKGADAVKDASENGGEVIYVLYDCNLRIGDRAKNDGTGLVIDY